MSEDRRKRLALKARRTSSNSVQNSVPEIAAQVMTKSCPEVPQLRATDGAAC